MSQDSIILEHLERGETITPLRAFDLCGSLACHSIMARLRPVVRSKGKDIAKEMRRENGKLFGAYRLVGQGELSI